MKGTVVDGVSQDRREHQVKNHRKQFTDYHPTVKPYLTSPVSWTIVRVPSLIFNMF